MGTRGVGSRIRRELRDGVWLSSRVLRKGIVSALPIPLHFGLAAQLGRVLPNGQGSDAAKRNLLSVFEGQLTSEEIDRVASEYHRFGKSAYLWRILPFLHGFNQAQRWPVEGKEYLDEAIARGRGVILATAHYGYPHIIPRILGVHGYTIKQVVAELDRLESRENTEAWLMKAGAFKRFIYRHTQVYAETLGPEDLVASLDIRPILAALSKNEILMIAGDGLRATEFKSFPLLGKDYPFPTGFIKIALMTRASVLPVFSFPSDTESTIRTVIGKVLFDEPHVSVEAALSQYVVALNEQLKRAPHFWQRWRRANFFEEVWEWAKNSQKDPFTKLRVKDEHSARTQGKHSDT